MRKSIEPLPNDRVNAPVKLKLKSAIQQIVDSING
jgi:hypothetical protein